jgi:ferritin
MEKTMLSDKMQEALNAQIKAEYYSSYLYLSMAAHCQAINLEGFSGWLRIQADEEMIHAMKIYDFVLERGGRVTLGAIDAPPSEWESPLAIFEATYAHEQHVTGLINKLVDLAISESDHATNAFLQWFVNEQVEEEASADAVLQKLKLVANAPGGLFMLDQEMAQRPAASAPSETA